MHKTQNKEKHKKHNAEKEKGEEHGSHQDNRGEPMCSWGASSYS